MNQKQGGIHFEYSEDGKIVKEEWMVAGSHIDQKTFEKYADKTMVIDWRENKTYTDGKKKSNKRYLEQGEAE